VDRVSKELNPGSRKRIGVFYYRGYMATYRYAEIVMPNEELDNFDSQLGLLAEEIYSRRIDITGGEVIEIAFMVGTEKQLRAFILWLGGKKHKEIAAEMGVSRRMVGYHLQALFKKIRKKHIPKGGLSEDY